MPDIFQDFLIHAPATKVFGAITTPRGLDTWWTKQSSRQGEDYELGFGPGNDWQATVTRSVPDREFELRIRTDDQDWSGTRVGFALGERNGSTSVQFRHTGWPESNDCYRISCYCWRCISACSSATSSGARSCRTRSDSRHSYW
jgi:uncharacterized protein YndB with AHSA1/START domain